MPVKTLHEAFEKARTLDAPLAERLDAYAQSLRALNRPMAEAVDRLVSRLQNGGTAVGAPSEGDIMPGFVLPDDTGRLVGLQDVTNQGPVAITFARGHWCPYWATPCSSSSCARVAADSHCASVKNCWSVS